MKPYEVMFIVHPHVEGDGAVDEQIERFGRLIVDSGGEVTAVDKWGKRRFAYEVQGLHEGYYVVMQFKAEDSVVDELSRVMRITDEIVRHMVVRLDESQIKSQRQDAESAEAEEAPSADAPAGDAAGGEAAEATENAEASTTASE